jgi:hypothetical protein
MHAVISAIHRNPQQKWTLASLARVAGMSRSSFAVRFKKIVGEPAMDYLTRWRMLIAADRLANSGMSIAAVAPTVSRAAPRTAVRWRPLNWYERSATAVDRQRCVGGHRAHTAHRAWGKGLSFERLILTSASMHRICWISKWLKCCAGIIGLEHPAPIRTRAILERHRRQCRGRRTDQRVFTQPLPHYSGRAGLSAPHDGTPGHRRHPR